MNCLNVGEPQHVMLRTFTCPGTAHDWSRLSKLRMAWAQLASCYSWLTDPLSTPCKIWLHLCSFAMPASSRYVSVCAAMWLTFGLATNNRFIWIPESLGAFLAVASLILCFTFKR